MLNQQKKQIWIILYHTDWSKPSNNQIIFKLEPLVKNSNSASVQLLVYQEQEVIIDFKKSSKEIIKLPKIKNYGINRNLMCSYLHL